METFGMNETRRTDQGYDIGPVVSRVRLAREAKFMSARELGLKSGLGHSYVARLERGRLSDLQLGTLHKLAATLGVRIEWLVSGIGPMA